MSLKTQPWLTIGEHTMTMTPLEVVNSFYEALSLGHAPAAIALLDDEVKWTEAETAPYYSGTWIGPKAVYKNLFEPLSREWSSFAVVPESSVVEGSVVVTFGTYAGTYKVTSKSMAAGFAHRWEVAGGKIISFQQYTDTASMNEVLN
jgi:ketosteroid isomerase-like protein